jgi:putative solute:sodium symporter small subunit
MAKPSPGEGREDKLKAYWRANTRLITVLLIIWFVAAYVHPPFAKALNNIHILTGFPLGYYLSSQGSLVVFVVLIFVYALVMNRVIDKKYGFEEEE